MWLIVGLGNPGPKYARNRHNLGFRVIDELARRYRIEAYRGKFGGEYASGQVAGHKAHLLKPMEYMNVSGHAVSRAAQFLKVAPSDIVVVYDEIDFPFGKARVKSGGGHGGHNGVRSIVQQLGTDAFARVRCGVGRPMRDDGTPADKRAVSSYLLSDFPADQAREVDDLVDLGANAVEAVVRDGVTEAMNRINGLT